MAPVYGVTHAQVAAEVPAVWPGGFTQATTPTAAQVDEWIAAADAVVALAVYGSTGVVATSTDPSAPIARQYIRNSVLYHALRAAYAGRAPEDVDRAARPYLDAAAEMLTTIRAMGSQAVGTGAATARVRGEDGTLVRGMLVDDVDLHAEPRSTLSPWSGPADGLTSRGVSRRGRY